jgi:hypothetical protein
MTNGPKFRSLQECVETIRRNCPSDHYVWVDTSKIVCDPEREFWEEESSMFVPSANLYRCATRHRGDRWEQALPRYLFRGEASNYPNTLTSLRRMEDSSALSASDKRIIRDLTHFVEQGLGRLSGERWMSQPFAEGVCQHYGLPTDIIDFTTRLDVAGFFAAGAVAGRAEGAICVLDLERVVWASGAPGLLLTDLTRHPWAPRPRGQSAYGVSDDAITSDFKDPPVCSKLGLEWYRFTNNGVDDSFQKVADAENLLDAAHDVMAGIVLMAVDEYVEREGPLTSTTAEWLATRLSHVRIVQRRGATGEPDDPVVVTWSQAGLAHDAENEKDRSIALWTGNAMFRDSFLPH